MVTLPRQDERSRAEPHMLVCGDDGLAPRLAAELRDVYRQRVVLVVPGERTEDAGTLASTVSRAAALLGRWGQGQARPGPDDSQPGLSTPVLELHAPRPGADVLTEAGVERAAAIALLYEDDETNLRAALAARRLNPSVRLVVRMYNRKLGEYMEELLDQAALMARPELDRATLEASTTVLSDADTAAPALAATAVADTRRVVQADGLLLRAAERTPPRTGETADPGLCTLALLSSTTADPAGAEGSDASGPQGPRLLPDDAEVRAATGRGTVVLDAVRRTGPVLPPRRLARRGAPLSRLFSRRLRWATAGVVASVLALAVATTVLADMGFLSATYLSLLDLLGIGDPATGQSAARQILQLLSGLVGLALLPLLVAAGLEALGTFRGAGALRRPPRGLSGHIVLLGLGRVGTRVLARLRELDMPVVCVEQSAEARGVPLARDLGVPVVLGDVTEAGVLGEAKIHRAAALLALTSSDTTNLEATLAARSIAPELRVALRLYDDEFATVVYRTLRAAHPRAVTRSRSVSHLSAPAFAAAMMGRQVLGAISIERKVLLFAALVVGGHPQFEGRTVAEAFRAGAWRVIALDTRRPEARRHDLAREARPDGPQLLWDLHPGYVLQPDDRIVLAVTRRGYAEILSTTRGATG